MIRKDAGLYCGPRLRKGEVFAYVGRIHNLKDLKSLKGRGWLGGAASKKSNLEVDVGTTWSNPSRLATQLIRISFSSPSGFEAGVGLMWV